MDSQTAVDLAREALSTALLVGAPVLLVGVVVGLLISLDAGPHADPGSDDLVCAQDRHHGAGVGVVPSLADPADDDLFRESDHQYSGDDYWEGEPRCEHGVSETQCLEQGKFMELLLSLYTNQFLVFLLVLTRVSGLVMVAPCLEFSRDTDASARFLAIGIALIITPLFWHTPIDDPGNLVQLAILLACEFAVGLALGLAVMICFAGMELAGQILGQMTGMSLADVASPDFDASVPVFSQFLHMLMLAVFILTGGHHYLLHAFLQSLPQHAARTGSFFPCR